MEGLSGGYDAASAETAPEGEACDLIAIGGTFRANLDVVARWTAGAELNWIDFEIFYAAGSKGFRDYPRL